MDPQMIAVIVIVSGAALYVLRALWKAIAKAGQAGCASGCGKCSGQDTTKSRSGMIPLDVVSKSAR